MGTTDLLRVMTCGSVDDGKSTLLGRLLHDTENVFDDQLSSLDVNGVVDYSRVLDGLESEREQGITIDVAYRYFRTANRRYILADCPGHEQYTRNMATGASNSDVAVLLVDVALGVRPQTFRHLCIAKYFGIKQVILAVNKMDRVDFEEDRFNENVALVAAFADQLGDLQLTAIPVSGTKGDNVTVRSPNTPWFDGPTLLEALETATPPSDAHDAMRMPVQYSLKDDDTRLYYGTIASGAMNVGDEIIIQPNATTSRITQLWIGGEEGSQAVQGASIAIALNDERDISRGDLIAARNAPCEVADQFEVDLLWMDSTELLPGRSYFFKSGTTERSAKVMTIKHKLDVESLSELAAKTLELNDLARCTLTLDQSIAFEPFDENRTLGSFILVDRVTNATVGAGMIRFALRRAHNIHWHTSAIDAQARATAMAQKPRVIWLTGLSGAGKSSIADEVDRTLHAQGRHTYILDGDNVRHGLNRDLGFTAEDRVENIRRIAEVAKLMADAGLIVLVSFISPYRADRDLAREVIGSNRFVEVYVDTPLQVAEERDVKGLYAKARRGEIKNFTGIDAPYEAPTNPEIIVTTEGRTSAESATDILEWLAQH